MKKIIIFGAGGHTQSLIDVINLHPCWEVDKLVGKKDDLGIRLGNFLIEIDDSDLDIKLFSQTNNVLIGVGQIGFDLRRRNLFQRIKNFNIIFPKIISPLAYFSKDSSIGDGTVIFHHALVNSGVTVGNHCIINSKSLIEHGSKIGDFCHVSTGAIINGGVNIGEGSFIGSGAIIREGLNLPDNTVIGAGKRVMGWPLCENEK
tara:strand:+ start:758 stop:1366 length:609 start_codon:yes stop_codon:yes gene_type:complete